MRTKNRLFTLLFCLLALTFFGRVEAYDEGAVDNGGSVSGFVYFAGTPPARKPLAMQAPCNHEAFSEEVVVNKPDGKSGGKDMGRLVNAVVMISDIKKGKPLGAIAPVPLDQKGCVFTPHVVWAPAGGKLKILNSDNAAHNVHSKSDLNTEFNAALAPKGETHAKFDEAERIKVRCDMHNWMTAWIVVAENPYIFVTGEDGSFKMDKVPPGSYTVTVWQETLGEQKAQVTVKAGEDAKLEITYK